MAWQGGEGCGADAGLPLGAGLNALALGWALCGGSAVVVLVRDPAHCGTSSVPDSRERTHSQKQL